MIDSKFNDIETMVQQVIFYKLPIDSIANILSVEISDSEGVALWKDATFSFFGQTVAEDGSINEHTTHIKKGDRPLAPFCYTKPQVKPWWNPTNINDIEEIKENTLRTWYYPLLITTDKVLRHPNHFYKADYGLFCAVKIENKRETRFFPKSNIPEDTRNEAQHYLEFPNFFDLTGLGFGSKITQS